VLFRIALAALNALEALKAVAVLAAQLAGNATPFAGHRGFVVGDRFHMFSILQGLAVLQEKTATPGLSVPRNPRLAEMGLSPLYWKFNGNDQRPNSHSDSGSPVVPTYF
jgi:hypothetical protein